MARNPNQYDDLLPEEHLDDENDLAEEHQGQERQRHRQRTMSYREILQNQGQPQPSDQEAMSYREMLQHKNQELLSHQTIATLAHQENARDDDHVAHYESALFDKLSNNAARAAWTNDNDLLKDFNSQQRHEILTDWVASFNKTQYSDPAEREQAAHLITEKAFHQAVKQVEFQEAASFYNFSEAQTEYLDRAKTTFNIQRLPGQEESILIIDFNNDKDAEKFIQLKDRETTAASFQPIETKSLYQHLDQCKQDFQDGILASDPTTAADTAHRLNQILQSVTNFADDQDNTDAEDRQDKQATYAEKATSQAEQREEQSDGWDWASRWANSR